MIIGGMLVKNIIAIRDEKVKATKIGILENKKINSVNAKTVSNSYPPVNKILWDHFK
jgi:hydroxymethylpyrimidine/phosphomethylpyrimidine kinase